MEKKSIVLIFMFSLFFIIVAKGAGLSGTCFVQNKDSTLNIHAPDFKLKDMDGNVVSLSDYKGKILILDFWATWCKPCRESFPIMKIVIDKFKNDPNVKFLFIDTQEKPDISKVKAIMSGNDYKFHIAFDQPGPNGTRSLTLALYKTPGIPTKYVIDSNGMIRFVDLGFNSAKSPEQLADELSIAIENAKKPILN
ncbi:TlpA family protein disulfide reductase [Mucilaginibacter sp. X4EP1]|jgi:thiol-disulfide isomerase/thioredoxin|uniref:TlpA family protein disulfide reductase n=1 Tax=Mucilaginibacter sp. X4EP1 TaxID=2723092 RepID=UPI0021679B42|nr:TlpA disulfide reductase family protein [Mucilaginibacter sp. X4EP1]MCS3812680.1 thiol-disulfide isomerase/thioredoxin [Mucilaginibacter sp. X4EP1]